MRYLFAYGTLRKGDYNYERFKHGIKYMQDYRLNNYRLYNLGSYPVAIEARSSNDSILCDILEITDKVYQEIKNMELGAGYQETNTGLTVHGPDSNLYIFTMSKIPEGASFIKSGDWFNRKEEIIKRKIFVSDNQHSYIRWMQGEITNKIEQADLVLFTGGEDVDPSLYGEKENYTTQSNIIRDKKEIEIYKKALSLGKNMLGICRGLN